MIFKGEESLNCTDPPLKISETFLQKRDERKRAGPGSRSRAMYDILRPEKG